MKLRWYMIFILTCWPVGAMEPTYTQVQKDINEVSATRSDGAHVQVRFNPLNNFYRGMIVGAPTAARRIRQGNIRFIFGAEAQQLYDHLMELMEIE